MEAGRPGLVRAIAALEHRDYRLLFAASFVSAIGGTLAQTANMWQVYELTGSAIHIGLTGIARAIPTIALSLVGGVIADRVDRRGIILATQAVNGLLAVILALLTAARLVDVWHIYAVTLLSASFMSVSVPARSAIVPNLVPRHHLVNAIALNFGMYQIARIVAPSLAGIAIVLFGLSITYAANGLAHLVSAAALARIYLGPTPPRPQESPLRSLVEGLAFVRRRSIILALLCTDAAAMLFGSFQVLLPIFADRLEVGAAGYGVLWSVEAVGALAGAMLIATLGDFRHKGYVIVGSILAYCGCLVALAASPWFLLTLIVCGALGLTDAMQATPRNGLIQLVTPNELRGRVSSFQHMMVMGTPSLGLGVMGAAAGVVGPSLALTVGAATCAAINIGILLGRRDMRARDLGTLPESQPARL